eukprot:CAMPEP_0201596348 /NCGR_PEP_ID=MMETSP0190_2-20130828/193055_1 /ASSEMBLY_ACC=CAM_ASM_000263 /TAXON_ID=37353 /ORGANISM="Rosalina sp." /LENGTH=497 /DNA_ID=CAMNT_0048056655 /DNA_START=697 /DNA_END=2190 /DNA_ORIENTATION=-
MVIIFLTIPIVIGVMYGGFVGQVVNSDDLPCDNSNEDMTSGCLNYEDRVPGTSDPGPTLIVDEFYIRMPSQITTINYVLFTLSLLSFALNPHMLQRAFTAKHDWQVRFVTGAIFVAGFLAQIPGVTTGIAYLSNKLSFKQEYQEMAAFQAMLGVFRDEGGFVGFLSYIALLAAIAGIMSTADSSLIGVSNTMSCDIFQNWLTPNASATKVVWIGKGISIVTMAISIGIAIYIYQSGIEYGVLLTLQQGILWQAFPAYAFGLYTNVGTRSVLFGIVTGVIFDIIFVILVFSGNDPFSAVDPALASLDKSWSSLIGVLFNLIAIGIGHWCIRWRDEYGKVEVDIETEDDSPQPINEHISIYDIRDIMGGISEPMTKCYGLPIWLSLIFLLVSAFHWIGEIDQDLVDDYGLETVRGFQYNGKITNVIAGLPSWSFASIMWYCASAIVGLYAVSLWSVDQRHEDKDIVPDKSNASIEAMSLNQNGENGNGHIVTASEGVDI